MLFIKDKKEIETEKQSSKAAGMKDKQPKLPGKSGKKKKKEEYFPELPNFSLELRQQGYLKTYVGWLEKCLQGR